MVQTTKSRLCLELDIKLFLFLQSYWNRDSTYNVFQIELMFMFIMTFFLLVMINIIWLSTLERLIAPPQNWI